MNLIFAILNYSFYEAMIKLNNFCLKILLKLKLKYKYTKLIVIYKWKLIIKNKLKAQQGNYILCNNYQLIQILEIILLKNT